MDICKSFYLYEYIILYALPWSIIKIENILLFIFKPYLLFVLNVVRNNWNIFFSRSKKQNMKKKKIPLPFGYLAVWGAVQGQLR